MGAKIQIKYDSVYNFPTRRMFPPDPADVPCRAVGLDLQSRPIEYKDFQSAGQQ